MPRTRTIPDPLIFASIRRLLNRGGDKAVSFASVQRLTGLAAATLVQRYGSRDRMVKAALWDGWDVLDARAASAIAETVDKAPQALLKALEADEDLVLLASDMRDAALRNRAAAWRLGVEAALAARMGGTDRAQEAATLLFAAWQGQMQWQKAGGAGFRLKDAVRRIT